MISVKEIESQIALGTASDLEPSIFSAAIDIGTDDDVLVYICGCERLPGGIRAAARETFAKKHAKCRDRGY